jgi:hypothetical protein
VVGRNILDDEGEGNLLKALEMNPKLGDVEG